MKETRRSELHSLCLLRFAIDKEGNWSQIFCVLEVTERPGKFLNFKAELNLLLPLM